MADKKDLDALYKQDLEESIIQHLCEIKKIEMREAVDIYYRSQLAQQISRGDYGIENLDYKYLAEDLVENEPELFVSRGINSQINDEQKALRNQFDTIIE